QRKLGSIDNRGSHFYLAMYWAQELAKQSEDTELATAFRPIAEELSAGEEPIAQGLIAVQGKPADIGGYDRPDPSKGDAVMRPSATFNRILEELSAALGPLSSPRHDPHGDGGPALVSAGPPSPSGMSGERHQPTRRIVTSKTSIPIACIDPRPLQELGRSPS